MRKAVKFLHTLASCVFVGALLAHALLLAVPPAQGSFAGTRAVIGMLGGWLLLPSLAVVTTSGLIAMAVHHPFQQFRWVWTKAVLGFPLFLATLHLQSMTGSAATLAARLPPGAGPSPALSAEIAQEGPVLAIVVILAVAQIVFGVWRPRLALRPAR